MTVSYALTTVAAVLLLEILLGTAVWAVLTFSPLAYSWTTPGARQTAKLYALTASAQAGGAALDPHTTFEPGQPSSIALSQGDFSNGGNIQIIQYNNTRSPNAQDAAFALLITPDGRVLASSYPARYPASTPIARLLPGKSQLIMKALAGVPGSTVDETSQGRSVSAVEDVLSHGKVIGAVYVQVPIISGGNFLPGFTGLILVSGVFWLVLMLLVGLVFGLITTRALVRRLRHLSSATTRFADGDFTQRVQVSRRDEVGQLEEQFNRMAEELVESMAQRQALAEQNARLEERARFDQELRTARLIQHSLLPKDVPTLPGWQIAPYYQPAREVGGDLYDFLMFEDGRLGLVIGDVSGKGVPAALVMATTQSMLRAAAQAAVSPGEVLARVNELLCVDMPPNLFVTCFYAILDPVSGRLHYANAGHDLPYRQYSGGVSELRATGMPLGLMPGMRYEENEATLASGDSVLFYTDGLVEAHNAKRDMFGFPHLMELVGRNLCSTTLIDSLLQELATFTGSDWEQEDDVTMLVLHRVPLVENVKQGEDDNLGVPVAGPELR
ncbi:MAG TPA: SpoIIE family protein phosphatase [Ktedonobacteraceae bacterium]|nr:SpoIIE family protein phosphatase [Ktedonobacteraceae bacterium]